jgi:hypothetical protein
MSISSSSDSSSRPPHSQIHLLKPKKSKHILEQNAVLFVKTVGRRQLLFIHKEDVDAFDDILLKRKAGVSMKEAYQLFGMSRMGDVSFTN